MKMFEEKIGKSVVIELKDGNKFFGKITKVDSSSNGNFTWVYIEKNNKENIIVDSEIKRIEELE